MRVFSYIRGGEVRIRPNRLIPKNVQLDCITAFCEYTAKTRSLPIISMQSTFIHKTDTILGHLKMRTLGCNGVRTFDQSSYPIANIPEYT